jgi:hypothetical protein
MKRETMGCGAYDMHPDDPKYIEWLQAQDRENFEMNIRLFVKMKRHHEWKSLWKDEHDARERFAKDLAKRLFESFTVRRLDWATLSPIAGSIDVKNER